MNVHYNPNGIGDVLLVSVDAGTITERDYQKHGEVVRLFDKKDGRTLGYNIFNVSRHFDLSGNGKIEVTETVVDEINRFLQKSDVGETIAFDTRPEFIVGHVTSKEKHPDADKLSICKVDIGDEVLQIVCGAPNVDKDHKVVVARVGAMMPSGMLIKEAELRGVPSSGMICSAKELDLPDAPKEKGILVLSDDYEIGADFFTHDK
ncbi:YtpR family tRNA-binding protein [Pseudalkalibacillus sp. R45]|uniref:YtpR family tRNA-binding protein n=1 Tax=Pseudalkalibacillus sp. R45 TaxID=3457433 RepID=UPI003FCE5086